MKVSPVSGDLLVKLAIGAGAALLLWYGLNRARGAVSGAADYLAGLPGRAYDGFADAVRVDIEPMNPDLGQYSQRIESDLANRGTGVNAVWWDFTHLFNF